MFQSFISIAIVFWAGSNSWNGCAFPFGGVVADVGVAVDFAGDVLFVAEHLVLGSL